MPFIVLPNGSNQVALNNAFSDGDKITYGEFKKWRDQHKNRNRDFGDLKGMNFKEDAIFTTYDKEIFKTLKNQNIGPKSTHIGIVFGSRKGNLFQGVGNYRDITAFLTLAQKQADGKVIPVGDAYRGGSEPPFKPNRFENFQKRYVSRIEKLRENKEAAGAFN